MVKKSYPVHPYLYCHKLESLSYMFVDDSMNLSVFVFTRKQKEFNVKWLPYSRSFKVTYFGICGKPTMDSISLCNNVGHISKGSDDIVSESRENSRCR